MKMSGMIKKQSIKEKRHLMKSGLINLRGTYAELVHFSFCGILQSNRIIYFDVVRSKRKHLSVLCRIKLKLHYLIST